MSENVQIEDKLLFFFFIKVLSFNHIIGGKKEFEEIIRW